MNELRAHPFRLLGIFVVALMAGTITYAAGSYGETGPPPVGAATPSAEAADPSNPPVAAETPTGAPSSVTPASGGPAPSGGSAGPTAPVPAAEADEPDPAQQPVRNDEPEPVDTQPEEPAPVTSTYVATPSHNTETPGPGGCGNRCR